MLPDEIIAQLNTEFPCREQVIRHLAALYAAHCPSPPFLNIHGLTATGKTSILRAYLQLSEIPHTIINVRECITARHLLERIVAASLDALDEDEDADQKIDRRPYARTENLSALCVNLGKLLHGRDKFVLVLDAMDKLREGGGGTLVAALARMGEVIPNLALILTTTLALTPSTLHSASTPFLQFPPYSRTELLTILLATRPPPIFPTPPSPAQFPDYTPDVAAEDDAWLWNRFLQAVHDALAKHTGRDLASLQRCAHTLWRPFVAPIVSGQFGTRDFARLMVRQRALFQREEVVRWSVVKTSLATSTTTTTATTPNTSTTPSKPTSKPPTSITPSPSSSLPLPYYTSHLLIAAYLASYNPPRTDPTYFMKHTDKRKAARRRVATIGTTLSGAPGTTKTRHRTISRHLLLPGPFSLDRLSAVMRAVVGAGAGHEGGCANGTGSGSGDGLQTADFYTQVATLGRLRLLVRTGAGGAGVTGGDVLEGGGGGKWRVNGVSWEFVRGLGRSVGVEVGELLVGGVD